MVWFGTHFLFGAGIGILIATILQIRYRVFTIAFVCGIWATLPDIHKPMESFGIPGAEIAADVHGHWVSNIFFLHYTLDLPFFRARQKMVLIAVVLWVIFAIVIYWAVKGRKP